MIAITRAVPESISRCALTFRDRAPIDPECARLQHQGYVAALERVGAAVTVLPALPAAPDSVFVEDPVLVLDEIAILLPVGAPTRSAEGETLRAAVGLHRELLTGGFPGTLEGGDVLRIGRRLFVGRSGRTSDEGIEGLRRVVARFEYEVIAVDIDGCLHLKTGCTFTGRELLLNPEWVDREPFGDLPLLIVDAAEPDAANVLRIGSSLLVSASFPRTAERLTERGHEVVPIEIGELEKAEAGLTCMSLLFTH